MENKTKAQFEQEIKDLKPQLESAKTKESYDNLQKRLKQCMIRMSRLVLQKSRLGLL